MIGFILGSTSIIALFVVALVLALRIALNGKL